MDLQVEMDAASCVFLALLFLSIPVSWILAAAFAATVHELAHMIAVCAAGGKIYGLKIRCCGMVMESSPLSAPQKLFCILAGPAASLFLLCVSRILPKVALCGAIQGIFNLIPMEPLDGGRALACIVNMLFNAGNAEKICNFIKFFVMVLLFACVICASAVLNPGLGIFVFPLFLLSRITGGKISCKDR